MTKEFVVREGGSPGAVLLSLCQDIMGTIAHAMMDTTVREALFADIERQPMLAVEMRAAAAALLKVVARWQGERAGKEGP